MQNRVKGQDTQSLAGGNTLALSSVNFHSLFIVEEKTLACRFVRHRSVLLFQRCGGGTLCKIGTKHRTQEPWLGATLSLSVQ